MDLALRGLGCQWELRRSGETSIGLWRIRVSDSAAGGKGALARRKPLPKRLVIIPGFGDTSLGWIAESALLRPALKRAGYDEVVVFDLPGFHGFLSEEKCFQSFDDFFAAASDALDSLRPHAVFGHSLGGWIAGDYAASCGEGKRPAAGAGGYAGPELLVVMNPSGAYGARAEIEGFKTLFNSAIEQGFHKLRPHVFRAEPLWFRLFAREFGDFVQRPDVVQFMRSLDERHLVQDRLANVRGKAWVIWGENDTLTPAVWVDAWLDRLTHPEVTARGVLLPGVGHSPHMESPAITAALLSQILLGKEPHRVGKRWWKLVLPHSPAPIAV